MNATRSGHRIGGEQGSSVEIDLLPGWQRIAWIAGIWLLGVGALALVTWAIGQLLIRS